MTVFVDTSAFYAVLDRADENHVSARDTWLRLLREEYVLLTTNYVLLETCALLQNRLGIPALRHFTRRLCRFSKLTGFRKTGISRVWKPHSSPRASA